MLGEKYNGPTENVVVSDLGGDVSGTVAEQVVDVAVYVVVDVVDVVVDLNGDDMSWTVVVRRTMYGV